MEFDSYDQVSLDAEPTIEDKVLSQEKAFKTGSYTTSIAITGIGAAEKTITEVLPNGVTMTFYDM